LEFFLTHFRFASAPWLFLLLPALLLLLLRRGIGAQSSLTFSSLSVLVSLGQKVRKRVGSFNISLAFLALIFSIIALSRPVWRKEYQNRTASGIDIMIAFDLSLSMKIDDFYNPSGRAMLRLDAAKSVVTNFVKNRPDDRIGLVVFSGQPYHISPITLDHDWLLNELARVKLNERNEEGTVREQGTAIGSAISAAATRLNARDAKSKIIVLITDGASNSGKISPVDAAKYAAELGIKIYAVALGTLEGRVDSSIQRFPRQEFDLPTLAEVARVTNGEHYWCQTNDKLKETFQTINNLEKTESKTFTTTEDQELFQYFVALSLILATITALSLIFSPLPEA
jgi:Ca-activated chloride channel homolog